MSIKKELLELGMQENEIGYSSFCSDLHVKKTNVSDAWLATYKFKSNVTTFTNAIDNLIWYEVPFGYMEEYINLKKGENEMNIIDNVHDYFNKLLRKYHDRYERLENKVLRVNMTDNEVDEALKTMENMQDEISRITFIQRKPLIKALKTAKLGYREKEVLGNRFEVAFNINNSVAGITASNTDKHGHRKGFEIVIRDYGNFKVGAITG